MVHPSLVPSSLGYSALREKFTSDAEAIVPNYCPESRPHSNKNYCPNVTKNH